MCLLQGYGIVPESTTITDTFKLNGSISKCHFLTLDLWRFASFRTSKFKLSKSKMQLYVVIQITWNNQLFYVCNCPHLKQGKLDNRQVDFFRTVKIDTFQAVTFNIHALLYVWNTLQFSIFPSFQWCPLQLTK